MRKVRRSEIVLWKCPSCGSKNKIYTILVDGAGNRIGSTLKCCNCGTLLKRLNDIDATNKDEIGDSYPGRQYCIKLHGGCSNCKTCKLNNKSGDNSDNNHDNGCNCDCKKCPYAACCKKQNSNKLTIKVNCLPKFID
jgi:hypothetical protein